MDSRITGRLSANQSVSGSLSPPCNLDGSLSIGGGTVPPDYEGEYEITPSDEAIVLLTEQRVARRNITIAPIPQNYGRITWNGAFLTVS